MKKIMTVAVLAIALAACGGNKKNETKSETTTSTTTAADNSRTSLDYTGTYKGVLPCADCEGINTEIILESDNYTVRTSYMGKSSEVFENKGKYMWDKAGQTITLEGITDAPAKYKVGENRLIQLDMEGNVIEGQLADKYILKKVK